MGIGSDGFRPDLSHGMAPWAYEAYRAYAELIRVSFGSEEADHQSDDCLMDPG